MKTDRKWFRHDRFGMFIHWGIYAVSGRREWIKNLERLSDAEYMKYYDNFDPDLFDPKGWAKAAAKAGMKYFVLTTKHHDGFCLYDSHYTDFKITNTGFGDSGEIRLSLPENDLVKLISSPTIENLAYGESATVTLKINPVALGNGLALNAPYSGSIGIVKWMGHVYTGITALADGYESHHTSTGFRLLQMQWHVHAHLGVNF